MKFTVEIGRMVFRAILAATSMIYTFCYIWKITFVPEGITVSKYAEFILGFLLGTLIATLLNFYFGGNENGETKNPGPIPDPNLGPTNHIVHAGAEIVAGHEPEGKSNLDDESV